MWWAIYALTLYPKQPKSSKPKFLLPFPPILAPTTLKSAPDWLANPETTLITIFGMECFRLQCQNTTTVSIVADSHNK